MWVYELSHWWVGLIVVGAFVTCALGLFRLFRRLCPRVFSDHQVENALQIVGVIATINSLLLAFTAVAVWEAFRDAETAVTLEAAAIGQMSRDLHSYGGPQAKGTLNALRAYTRTIVEDEWPLLKTGGSSAKSWQALDQLFRDVSEIRPKDGRDQIILAEIWARLNEVVKYRRERIQSARAQVPGTLWVVVVLGSLLTFSFSFVLLPDTYGHAVIAGLAGVTGLVVFFIVAMEHPFAGQESVDKQPYELFLINSVKREAESDRLARGMTVESRRGSVLPMK